MKKAIIITISLILLLLSFTACNNSGSIKNCERSISESELYTEDEINKLMDIVADYFKAEFEGCELKELEYDEDYSVERSSGWAQQYDADRAIVFLSSFYVSPTGGDGSLNQDSTYKNWSWILTQTDNENWVLRTWGY